MSDILEKIEQIQTNIREIKSTMGNTIMMLDNIKSGLKEDKQKVFDEAYQRGLEEGKEQSDRGCEGCKWEGMTGQPPCIQCSNNYPNVWQKQDDKIEVGDEVEVLKTGSKYLIAWISGTIICGFSYAGITCRLQPSDVRKTGRHFDIDKILEEMRT